MRLNGDDDRLARLPNMSIGPPIPPILLDAEPQILLTSPSFDGQIEPGRERLLDYDGVGTWSWRVHANTPGDFTLVIMFSMRDEDVGPVVEDMRTEVDLHSHGTVSYYAGKASSTVHEFIASPRGWIMASAAITALVAISIMSWRMSRRRGTR